jgi:hypothetical protein
MLALSFSGFDLSLQADTYVVISFDHLVCADKQERRATPSK